MREHLNGLKPTKPAKIQRIQLQLQSQKHPCHILDASPYPFLVSFFLLALLTPVTLYMHGVELAGPVLLVYHPNVPHSIPLPRRCRTFSTQPAVPVLPEVSIPSRGRFA